MEDAVSHLRTPKEWPRPNRAFSNSGSLKTSELLVLAGTYPTRYTDLVYYRTKLVHKAY
jgi:hypothetical protein